MGLIKYEFSLMLLFILVLAVSSQIIIQPVHSKSESKIADIISDLREETNLSTDHIINETRASKVGEVIIGQFIIGLKENLTDSIFNVSIASVTNELNSAGVDVLYKYNQTNSLAIEIPIQVTPTTDLFNSTLSNATKVCEIITKDPRIKSCEPNRVILAQNSAPNESIGYNLNRTNAFPPIIRDLSDTAVDIAIVDSGIFDHADLNIFNKISFIPNKINDDCGHGTHVAGIVGSKYNTSGTVGIAPNAKLWSVKVLSNIFDGLDLTPHCTGSLASLSAGLEYVLDHADEIDIVNLSLECYCNSPQVNQLLEKLAEENVIVVVSAGNGGKDTSSYTPTKIPSAVVVSNVVDTDGKCGGTGPTSEKGDDDNLASDSNFGPTVDIAAPGVDINSTWMDGTYMKLSGTSMSAPLVAGAIGIYKAQHPGLSSDDIINLLLSESTSSVSSCDGNNKGYFTGDRDDFHEPLLFIDTIQ